MCFLGHSAALSGAEIALQRLLPELDVDPVVVLAEDGPLVAALRADGFDVRVVPLPSRVGAYRRDSGIRSVLGDLMGFLGYLRRLRRVVASIDPHLVHTNSMKAHVYGGLVGRSLRVPVVWHVRDRLAPDYLGARSARVMRALARVLPRLVLSPSAGTAATVGRDDVVVVPDCQTITRRRAAGTGRVPEVRDTVARIGIVGRISEWKGQHVVLEALAQSGLAGVELRIIGSAMFGETAYEDRLRGLAADLLEPGHVVFRGFCPDVPAELEELDIVVHASTIPEPFGQVVIEAMAAGVPVVAADRGGPAEVITSGVDGVLVPPSDPALLAAALDDLADAGRRRSLRDAALVTAARYTPERTGAGVRGAYERVEVRGPWPELTDPGRGGER